MEPYSSTRASSTKNLIRLMDNIETRLITTVYSNGKLTNNFSHQERHSKEKKWVWMMFVEALY